MKNYSWSRCYRIGRGTPPFLHSTLPFANEFSGECDELKAGSDLENIKDNAEEM